MRDLLRGYADQGGTVLLSSHLLHEIEVIADDLVVIGHGRIVAQGTKAELLAGRRHRRTRAADVAALWPAPSTQPASPPPPPADGAAAHRRRPRPGRARSRSPPASPSPSSAPPTAPGSRRCSSSSPPTPSEKEQQHEHHHRRHRTTSEPARGRRTEHAPDPAHAGSSAVELRKMFDTRSGFWLMASIGDHRRCSPPARSSLFAPDERADLRHLRRRDRLPDDGHPADDRDPRRSPASGASAAA